MEKIMKAANEMFLNLGYKKVENFPNPYICYKNEKEDTVILVYMIGSYFKKYQHGESSCFTRNEILACAQLIKELDEKYG